MRTSVGFGLLVAGALTSVAALSARARATGFTEIGEDLSRRQEKTVRLEGALRLRGEVLHDMDLDRGPTDSGRPLFPLPVDDPSSKTLRHADMRLRTDVTVYAPGGTVAVKSRIDVLDNVSLGGNTTGVSAASTTQRPPSDAFRVKRAYGEALTPFGVLAAGRMGNQWGLGILANGGDCADCDGGDVADRVAFVTPLASHIWAVAYDFSAVGATQARRDGARRIGLAPSTDVHTVTFAVMRWRSELARERRSRAGRVTLDYGAYATHRWQNNDIPSAYLSEQLGVAVPPTSALLIHRGLRATAADVWARFVHSFTRVELEAVAVFASFDQTSLVPGVELNAKATARQLGAALESDFGAPDDALGAGLDAGYASGDRSPLFGAPTEASAVPADLRIDKFRFSPDYRVDRILFRELVGAVTNAIYARPHARWTIGRSSIGTLTASIAAIASWATTAAATPSGSAPLGLELDPTLLYQSRDGFGAALEYAVFFPMSALDNTSARLSAKPAQLARIRLQYGF